MSRTVVSLAAGALTPLFLLAGSQVLSTSSTPWEAVLAAAVLASLSFLLLPPIRPAVFSIAFAIAAPIWYTILAGAMRSGNLFGLGLIVVAAAGVLVALIAAGIAVALRRLRLPPWTPAAPLMVAAVALVAGAAVRSSETDDQLHQLARFFQQLDLAERAYAAGPPFRGYTCNGPDLPSIKGIPWRTDYNLGGNDRNQGPYAGFWIVLRCQAAARPSYYSVMAAPTSGVGQVLTYDSRSGRISGRPVR